MAYASASDVAALCQSLLGPNANFTTSTSPTLTEVSSWLSGGCAILEAKIASRGYAIPVTAATTAYDWIKDLNALYAAAKAESSRTAATVSVTERTRGQVFMKDFWDQLKQLISVDMTMMGLERDAEVPVYVGGIDQDEKDDRADGMVAPRFRRGQFKFTGTLDPSADTEDPDNDND